MSERARVLSILTAIGVTLAGSPASAEILSDWPCKGCFTAAPDGADAGRTPRPLLVALHGDGGGASKLFQSWKAACEAAGVILVAPRCPVDQGCPAGSFWQWYFSNRHDPAWLGAQIDAVTARFPVDASRIYATGYSGGGTYLGYYGPEHPRKFGAIAYVAGGMPFHVPCPDCKVPVIFVIGSSDPMVVPYTRPLREWYEGCGGHEVVWESLRGVSHEGILDVLRGGKAKEILGWLLARPAACTVATSVDGGAGAVANAGSDAGPDRPNEVDAGATQSVPAAPSASGSKPVAPSAASGEPASRSPRPPPGCGCAAEGRGGGAGEGIAAAILAGALASRRRRAGLRARGRAR